MNKPTISVTLHKCRKTYYIEVLAIVPRYVYRIPCSSWKRLTEILEVELNYLNFDVGVVANYTCNKMPKCVYNCSLHPLAFVCDFSTLPLECIKEAVDFINDFERGALHD